MSRARTRLLGARGSGERSPRFFHLAHLRKMRRTEKVASVCFRVRNGEIEFLLVQTRAGRWTFPKGNAEPGLTHAQAAALEAFEEAGVHGRIQEVPFARYTQKKRSATKSNPAIEIGVNAHLCEVSRLDSPQETKRNRTWFSPEKAKRRLCEQRNTAYAAELVRVVELAVRNIRRLAA